MAVKRMTVIAISVPVSEVSTAASARVKPGHKLA